MPVHNILISNLNSTAKVSGNYCLVIVFLLVCNIAFADDPGIAKVRLIQQTNTTYTFEIDIAQSLLWTIKEPVFPERFNLSDLEYEDQSGWITLRAKISTKQEPLSPKDEIVLPWIRNGVDISVQWNDGRIYKGLYQRTLDGIHIPLKELMPVNKKTEEVLQENFELGVKHFPFKFAHILLILALIMAFPSFRVFQYLFAITLGHWVAMFIVGQDITSIDLLFSEILILIAAFIISYSVIYGIKFKYLAILLFLIGVSHGISYVHEIDSVEITPTQKIQALFAFDLAIDLGHYLIALVLVLFILLLKKKIKIIRWIPLITGSMAIFLILLIGRENILSNNMRILEFQRYPKATIYKSSANAQGGSQRNAQQGKGIMTSPIMLYLSVEPYEVRQEILITAEVAFQILGSNFNDETKIPIKVQDRVKKDLQYAVSSSDIMYINNHRVVSTEQITNFVSLGRGGVATRENPVEENIKDAILGITLIYETESFPDSISMNWQIFPESVQFIEASAVGPHGAFTTKLSPNENNLSWKSRIAGYKVPAIESIVVEIPARPLISIFLWLILVGFLFYQLVRNRTLSIKPWIVVILILGFISYPFVRFQLDLPFLPNGKPSYEKSGVILNDLLSNVYRAFDRRNENDVYDLLELSVSDNQLTEIYIQNRQSMALEKRGGARANVDEVNIQELFDVDRDQESGYIADAQWTVRGSVNHFGHTHYRLNQYRALVSFVIDNGSWKIDDIEILDTRRLY